MNKDYMVSLILTARRVLREARKPIVHSKMSLDVSISPESGSEEKCGVLKGGANWDFKLFDALLVLLAILILCTGTVRCLCRRIFRIFR